MKSLSLLKFVKDEKMRDDIIRTNTKYNAKCGGGSSNNVATNSDQLYASLLQSEMQTPRRVAADFDNFLYESLAEHNPTILVKKQQQRPPIRKSNHQ